MLRLLIGAGGVALVASLFLPWIDVAGTTASGWEVWTPADLLLATAGVTGIAAAITGGRVGLFRPDLSLNGATDLLGVLATLLIGWWILFDASDGGLEIGAFVALAGAIAMAGAAGDYRTLRGAPAFARLDDDR